MASDATVKALLSSSNQTYSAGALNKATAATTAVTTNNDSIFLFLFYVIYTT